LAIWGVLLKISRVVVLKAKSPEDHRDHRVRVVVPRVLREIRVLLVFRGLRG
jgi:hypothetical protein